MHCIRATSVSSPVSSALQTRHRTECRVVRRTEYHDASLENCITHTFCARLRSRLAPVSCHVLDSTAASIGNTGTHECFHKYIQTWGYEERPRSRRGTHMGKAPGESRAAVYPRAVRGPLVRAMPQRQQRWRESPSRTFVGVTRLLRTTRPSLRGCRGRSQMVAHHEVRVVSNDLGWLRISRLPLSTHVRE